MSLLTTAKMVFDVVAKIVDLHEAGVDRKIVDRIHQAVDDVRAIIEDHHNKHVKEKNSAD